MTGTNSGNKQIKIWNPSNGSLLSSFSSETSAIRSLKRLPNFRIAVALDNFNIKIYSLLNKTLLATLTGHAALIKSLVLLNNMTFVSGSCDGTIKFWDLNNYGLKRTLTDSSQIYALELISFKGYLVSGLYSGLISIWNLTSYSVIKTLNHGTSLHTDCLLLLDYERFASGDEFMYLKIWNIDSLTLNRTISTSAAYHMVLLNENVLGFITPASSINGFYLFNFSNSVNVPVFKIKDAAYYYDYIIAINSSLVAVSDTGFNVHLYNINTMSDIKITGFGDNIEAMELVEICPSII